MTDLEAFKAMLARAGVRFEEPAPRDGQAAIIVYEEENTKIWTGYPHFGFDFEFDATGALREVGAWE